jgi:predicted LPLAT superfamily acyltransferase
MIALRTRESAYEVRVESLSDGVVPSQVRRDRVVAELCQTFVDRLADNCRRAPYQWFNFFDFWIDRDYPQG